MEVSTFDGKAINLQIQESQWNQTQETWKQIITKHVRISYTNKKTVMGRQKGQIAFRRRKKGDRFLFKNNASSQKTLVGDYRCFDGGCGVAITPEGGGSILLKYKQAHQWMLSQ